VSLIIEPLLYWGVAVLVVLAATAIEAQSTRLDPWTMYLAGIVGLGGALVGGELYASFLASEPAGDAQRAAIGALIGAAAFGGLLLKLRGGDLLRYVDAAVPGIALGYAVYRIGCFVNGCCFGTPTDLPWGVTFGPGTEAFVSQVAQGLISSEAARTLSVHPTQLYHAVLGLAAFLILRRHSGSRLALALALYGGARFVIEFFRADTQPVIGSLDPNHLACLVMLAVALLLWRFAGRARSRSFVRKQTA
jgi:phosphatidylglycerol:prolipoprotein diacylglycerol transferase